MKALALLILAATLVARGAPARAADAPPPATVTGSARASVAATAPTTSPMARLRATPTAVRLVPASTRPVAPRPTKAIDPAGCVTPDCHVSVKNFKVLHGPVNVNSCDACHKLVDDKKHKFAARREKAELCTFCHQPTKPDEKVVHKPVADGDCLGCHNPHGGETKRFVHGKTMADLCNRCHESVVADRKVLHGPVASGTCDSCHASHSSKFPKLVNAQGTDLCYGCHDQMKAQLATAKSKHKALDKGCLECHDAHGSNAVMITKADPLTLCTSCHEHENVKTAVTTAKHKHSIVTKDQACLNCHTAHGGDLTKLMKKEPIKVCMTCHDKPQDAGGGRTVAAVPEVLDPALVKHGPIRDGNCGGCHSVHGSDEAQLLAKPYSAAFYQPYSAEKYGLCFSCHEKSLVESPKSKGLTGFRNGDQNLHFVHVAKSEKGRNCRSCHSTHASNHELHVRDKVQFGKWEMPINFKKAPAGGSCTPGCHKPYDYDREKPVNYKAEPATAGAAASPATTTAPAAATVGPVKSTNN